MHNIVIYNSRDNYQTEGVHRFIAALGEQELIHNSYEFIQLGLNHRDIQIAVKLAMKICLVVNLPIKEHFKPIYLCEGPLTSQCWRLSDAAAKLVLINVRTPIRLKKA